MSLRKGPAVAQRTASILIEADEAAHAALPARQRAYSNACNVLVPMVVENRWNRYSLHNLAYRRLRTETRLGAQMCANALPTVTAPYKAMRPNGTIKRNEPVPTITFRGTSVHFDSRTFAKRGNTLSLSTLTGRVVVTLKPGKHQLHLLDWGRPKEAELVFPKGKLFFNLVLEKQIELRTTGPVLGLDFG